MMATEILGLAKNRDSTYRKDGDRLPVIVAVGDPRRVRIGISIQRNYPLTSIDRSYGLPLGRFRSDATQMLSDTDELHGHKWSIETHEAVLAADAATEDRLKSHTQLPVHRAGTDTLWLCRYHCSEPALVWRNSLPIRTRVCP
jgi:hypothetical protein